MPVFGDTLRQARAQKGITLREAESALKINRHYLAALEEESFEHLPALTYQRGIVRSYAAYLGLDPVRLVALFEESRGPGAPEETITSPLQPTEMPHHWAPNFAIIAFTMIAGAVMLTWLYSAYFNAPVDEQVVVGLQPTVTPVNEGGLYIPSPTPLVPTATATLPPSPTPQPTSTPEPTVAVGIIGNGAAESADTGTEALVVTDRTEPSLPAALPAGRVAIRVQAASDIGIEMAADGILVFQGTLAAGESTGWAVGSTFTVKTSRGIDTLFTNHLGQEFQMGVQPDEVVYYLSA
jgi:cytoskeletal protein RodZ